MYREGDEIDIWVVEAALGQGGMGSVYRCHNRSARRILAAIKVLDGSLNRIPKVQARFIREAEILFALDHPHIVKVRNVRIELDPPYLEMEFVDGRSLEARLEDGPIPLHDAVMMLREMADALAYLHARNIRHRDLKPSNIVCQADGHCKLVDFGIATELDGATLSDHGQAMGSASYVPPEWVQPGLDPAKWDLYALGVCAWESLTGDVAFPMPQEGTPSQRFLQTVALKQTSAPLDPGPEFPLALRALIRELTHPNPRRRLPSAAVLNARISALDLQTVDAHHVFEDRPERSPTETMVPDGAAEQIRGHRRPPAEEAPVSTLGNSRRAEPTFDETSTVRPRGRPVTAPAPPAPPANPPPRARVGVPLALAASLGALTVGAVALAVWLWPAPAPVVPPKPTALPRALTLIVSGVPAGVPVALTLDGTPVPSDAGRWSAGSVGVGPHTLISTVGADCGEPVASWCRQVTTPLLVHEGAGEQAEVVQLPAPGPREVTLGGLEGTVTIDGVGEARRSPGGRTFEALMPGRYTVTLSDGTTRPLEVPWADGPLLVAAVSPGAPTATEPSGTHTAPPDPAAVEPVRPTTTPVASEPGPASGAAAHAVSIRSFAAWLADHPEWQHDAAIAAGTAAEGYLKGWNGAEPPAGQGDRAVVNVSWAAAQAYCKGHGGLADVGAEPLGWQESSAQPWHEYRQDNGAPAWRRSDASVSATVPRSQVNGVTGIRCAN